MNLHSNTIGPQPQVTFSSNNLLIAGIIKMRVKDFLREGQRSLQTILHNIQSLLEQLAG